MLSVPMIVYERELPEFFSDPLHPYAIYRLPFAHERIPEHAKHRNPMNHTTAKFRREAVLRAVKYQHAPGLDEERVRLLVRLPVRLDLESVLRSAYARALRSEIQSGLS